MWKRLITLSLTFGLAAAAPPAVAQVVCGPHEAIMERLVADFDETRIGRGLQTPTRLFEVWRSEESGSWTILLLRADGVACIMAHGAAWIDELPPTAAIDSLYRQ